MSYVDHFEKAAVSIKRAVFSQKSKFRTSESFDNSKI